MHPRQASKIDALRLLGFGLTDYNTFKKAASFGMIRPDEFKRIENYKPGQRWVQAWDDPGNNQTKDHMLSRKNAYCNHHEIKDLLGISIVCALMQHAQRYHLGEMPSKNHVLWLTAVITGHPANAAMMTARDISSKGSRSSINMRQLMHKVIEWEKVNCLAGL